MPRQKVKISYILKTKARIACYNNRKKGLMKKLDELSTLCGVDACAILYGLTEPALEVWPNNAGVLHVLNKFMAMSVIDQTKHLVDKETYLESMIEKAKAQIKKQIKMNRELELANMISECLTDNLSVAYLNVQDLEHLSSLTNNNLAEIEERLKIFKLGGPAAAPPPQSDLPESQVVVVGGSDHSAYHMVADGIGMDFYVPIMQDPAAFDGIRTTMYPDWIDNNLTEANEWGSCSRIWPDYWLS